jgi:hypothetical protein
MDKEALCYFVVKRQQLCAAECAAGQMNRSALFVHLSKKFHP